MRVAPIAPLEKQCARAAGSQRRPLGVARGRVMDTPTLHQLNSPLTGQEHRVLQGIADGVTTVTMSRHLGVTVNTVNAHVRNLCRKLGAKTRAHAVAKAMRSGLIL